MATRLSRSWLYKLLIQASKASKDGFTLIELLVAIIISALVVTGLLYLVVEMLQLDRREFVLNQTQQDMQRSLEYMTSDIQEAVFVYSNPTVVTANLPDLTANGEIPIVAFWRPSPISDAEFLAIDDCTIFPTTPTNQQDECEVLKIRQATQSLVVYLLKENNDGSLWEGESRIIRYELPKYTNVATLTQTPGYVDPLSNLDFVGWTPDPAALTIGGNSAVLTDYVDASTATVNPAPACPNAEYVRSPASVGGNDVTSFVACVLAPGGISTTQQNQDVYFFLRGNALADRPGLINARNEGSDNPTLQTRVQVRGVLDKNPN